MPTKAVRTRLQPGKEDWYDEFHRVIPDEVRDDLLRNGYTEWLIFRNAQDLFHVITSEEVPADQLDPDVSREIGARWHALVDPNLAEVEGTQKSADMKLVWSLSENGLEPREA